MLLNLHVFFHSLCQVACSNPPVLFSLWIRFPACTGLQGLRSPALTPCIPGLQAISGEAQLFPGSQRVSHFQELPCPAEGWALCWFLTQLKLMARAGTPAPGNHVSFVRWSWCVSGMNLLWGFLQWQPTPMFLPGKSQGRGSLVGCCLWGHTESDMTEVT